MVRFVFAVTALFVMSLGTTAFAKSGDIAERPLSGRIAGIDISGFRATITEHVLILYTGKNPGFDYGTKVTLFFAIDGATNQDVDIDQSHTRTNVHAHFKSKDHGAIDGVVTDGMKIRIVTGEEKDWRIPAQMRFQSTQPVSASFEGVFEIATSGLVATDGVVDRTHDHLDTVQWVARRHVESAHRGKFVTFDSSRVHWMQRAPKKPSKAGRRHAAAYSVVYRVDNGPDRIAKLLLAKDENGWAVDGELAPEQVIAAHPINPPRKNRPPWIFAPRAAAAFERDVYAASGWRKISEPSLPTCGGGQGKAHYGYCELRYKRLDAKGEDRGCEIATYLFEKDASGEWRVSERLSTAKRFDARGEKVTDRELDKLRC